MEVRGPEMLGIEHTESAFLSAVQGLPIPSSALIALIAVLFVGTLVLRGQRQASTFAEAASAAEAAPTTHPEPQTSVQLSTTAHPDTHRGATMSSITDFPHAGADQDEAQSMSSLRSKPQAERRASPTAGFHLHWGRTLVALLGAAALLTAVVTGILAPLTAVTAGLPLTAALVFLLCLTGLRTMAVLRRRGRRRQRVQAAIEDAMNPLQTTPWANQGDAGLFDALSADDRGSGGPNSLQQTDEDGLPVGLERTFGAEVQASGPVLGDAAEPVGPWQPRPVPRPKYLQLDKAPRREPEALEVQSHAPGSDVRLTQRRFVETAPAAGQVGATEVAGATARTSAASEVSAPRHDSLNLDEVLKRRRA